MSSERAPRVLLGGWYGAANLGDELVFATFVRWLREAGAQPRAISVHPRLTERECGVPAVGYGDLPAIVEAMAEADRFVLGGGGLFQDYEPFDRASLARFPAYNVAQFAQFARLAAGARRAGRRARAGRGTARRWRGEGDRRGGLQPRRRGFGARRGVGRGAAGPGRGARDAGRAGSRLDVPQRSARHARALPLVARAQRAGGRGARLAVRSPLGGAFRRRARRRAAPSWAFLWLDFARLPDATGEGAANDEIAGRLAARIPGRVHAIWRGMRLDEAAGLIAGCDAAVAMRLHAALLAHGAGLPVIALEYDDKVRALGDDAGAPASMRMPLADVTQRLPAALALVASGAAPRLAAERREELATRALAHRDLLLRALDQPASAPRVALPALLPGWREELAAEARARVDAALVGRRGHAGCA